MDFKNQVDPVLGQLNDLRFNRGGEIATSPVNAENPFNVVLDLGPGIDHSGAKGDFGVQILGADFLVSIEGDPVNDGIFDDLNQQGVALTA